MLSVFCLFGKAVCADASIPFELINGLILIEAEVNGNLGNYILDSGSNGILLNGLSGDSDVSYQTLSSTLNGREKKINLFKVGDFEVSELFGFSTDLSNLETYLNKSLDGILGCSIFTPNSLLFDFENSRLIISEKDLPQEVVNSYSSISFKIVEDLPIAELNILGEKHSFILDSGASSHFIDPNEIHSFETYFIPTGIEKNIVTAGGTDKVSREFELQGNLLGNTEVSFQAFEKDFALISTALGTKISGLLSLSKISKSTVFFDLKSKKLFFN